MADEARRLGDGREVLALHNARNKIISTHLRFRQSLPAYTSHLFHITAAVTGAYHKASLLVLPEDVLLCSGFLLAHTVLHLVRVLEVHNVGG